jgi:predicted membrane-bound spermidine synthase
MMVDIDGDVVEACREHLPEMHQGVFEDSRTNLVIGDALEVLDTTDRSGILSFQTCLTRLKRDHRFNCLRKSILSESSGF